MAKKDEVVDVLAEIEEKYGECVIDLSGGFWSVHLPYGDDETVEGVGTNLPGAYQEAVLEIRNKEMGIDD